MAEATTEVGGINVRVIVTDDGHAEVHTDEMCNCLEFISSGGKETSVLLPDDVGFAVDDDVPWDKRKLRYNKDDALRVDSYADAGRNEEDFDSLHYYDVVETGEYDVPVQHDGMTTVDVGDYTVEVVADEADNRVDISHVSPQQQNDFGDYVEDVAHSWNNVVINDGDGGGDYDAAIVAGSSHGSMAVGQWFDNLVADDRIEIRYIGTVGAADSDRDLPDWADEEWEHRGAIFVGDAETSS